MPTVGEGEQLKGFYENLSDLKRDVKSESGKTIGKRILREKAETLGEKWFSTYAGKLSNSNVISAETLEYYSCLFKRLMKISAPNNLKSSYIEVLGSLTKTFRNDLIIPMKTVSISSSIPLSELDKLLESVEDADENQYLKEAISCAKKEFFRASIVMGWCATIDRIHRFIESCGFVRFNVASTRLSGVKQGRYKRFNSPQNVNSLSELQGVFDTIILWVLEGMGVIDSNQHTRLQSCFVLRCNCAHPGEAPITEYNLLSFYSDIIEIVLKNENLSLVQGGEK